MVAHVIVNDYHIVVDAEVRVVPVLVLASDTDDASIGELRLGLTLAIPKGPGGVPCSWLPLAVWVGDALRYDLVGVPAKEIGSVLTYAIS